MKYIGRWMMLAVACIILSASSCKKEVKGIEIPDLPTKWERIAGTYNVYDTTGVYLYEMKISHSYNSELKHDTLIFENFDDEFNISARQFEFSNFPMFVSIGAHDTLYDSQSKRWKMHNGAIDDFNQFKNDTIKFLFQKTNINYYLSDLTPYYSCYCKQVAVKQH